MILQAIKRATSQRSSSVATRLDANLGDQINAAQRRFVSTAADATSSVAGLSVAIPVLTALAAVLAVIGLRQRLVEYR